MTPDQLLAQADIEEAMTQQNYVGDLALRIDGVWVSCRTLGRGPSPEEPDYAVWSGSCWETPAEAEVRFAKLNETLRSSGVMDVEFGSGNPTRRRLK